MNDKIFEIMVLNGIYPLWKGNRFFLININHLDSKLREEILKEIKITNKSECDNLRKRIVEERRKRKSNISIKKWAKNERPREIFLSKGASALDDVMLLAIILRTGIDGKSAVELARDLLNSCSGSLRELDNLSIDKLRKIKGIGISKSILIKACFEIGKRLYSEKASFNKKIKRLDDVIDYVRDSFSLYLRDEKKEHFIVLLVDTKNKIIESREVSIGGLNSSVVEPKEIVRYASEKMAGGVILIHNHPSGDVNPSESDISLTKKIINACSFINVRVLDHIIIGKNIEDYFSFAREGILI